MDKDKLFKDNVLLINENYKLNNQYNSIGNVLKNYGVNKENLTDIFERLRVNLKIFLFNKIFLVS